MDKVRAHSAAAEAARVFSWTGLALAALSVILVIAGGADWRLPLAALAAFGVVAAATVPQVAARHPHPRFGSANVVTTVRAAAVCLFAGMILDADGFSAGALGWTAFGLAVLCLALDGADGWLARRSGLASPFGGRFDIEIDGLMGVFVWALVYAEGKAGAWVMTLAAMRYLFMAAGRVWPELRADLGPSLRRKAVGVLQGVVLCAVLLPLTQPPWSGALAAVALAALGWSFLADTLRLLSRGPAHGVAARKARRPRRLAA